MRYWKDDDYYYDDPYESYGESSSSDDDADADDANVESATLEEWLQWNYSDVSEDDPRYDEILEEALEHYLFEGVVPALCAENCSVELDGHCSHGHPSPFLELGLI